MYFLYGKAIEEKKAQGTKLSAGDWGCSPKRSSAPRLPALKSGRADCRQKAILPLGGRIALSANERIAEFLDLAIQTKFADVNKLPALKSGRVLWYTEYDF